MNAALYALEILRWLSEALNAGLDVKPILDEGNRMLKLFNDEGRGPTDAEWEEALAKRHSIDQQIRDAAAKHGV
jgi:hypothetical protein